MTDAVCPQCGDESAVVDREYGVLPGELCQVLNDAIPKPSQTHTYDFASPTTKQHRKEYGHEMYQPYVNGVLSKEFVETQGTDKLHGVTKKDIKNAKYVYQGMTRHHTMLQRGVAKFKGGRIDEQPSDYQVIEGRIKD
jgi:hypothetical protein